MTALDATAVALPAGRVRKRRSGAAYALIAPNTLLLALFVLYPLIDAVVISLHTSDGIGADRFVGFANYSRLFSDPVFWRVTGNTLLFTVIVTPGSMALGLGIAWLLNSALPARGLFRSILIIPMAVSGVATAALGGLLFDQNSGLINHFLRDVGLSAVNFGSDSVPAFVSIVITTLWWRVGINMLVYLAGLQSIDTQVLEAAALDGAGAWQRFRSVVVPMLAPSSFFLVVMNVIYSFQAFDIVYVLTGGGPHNSTALLVTYAYDTGFVTRDQGYSAAIGMVLLLFTAAFTAVRWQLNRSREI